MVGERKNIFDCDKCLFKGIAIQYLSNEDFEKIQNCAIQLKFKKGETILKQGAKATHIVYLHNGKVKFNYENDGGKNLILTITNAPSILGGANLFYEGINIFSICAIEDCEVCLIEVETIKNIILNNSALTLKLVEMVALSFRASVMNFITKAHKQVNGRVADVLIYLSNNIYHKKSFRLDLSRKELSEFAGCSQENLINTISHFNKEKIIKVDGKNIEILDFDKLEKISRLG